MKNVFCFIFTLFQVQFALAADNSKYLPCKEDKDRQARRSGELAKLLAEDQASRAGSDPWKTIDLEADRARRMRVGEIFGEGCFSNANDYAAAALIFQHADSSNPDHFFQTFLWAKKAVELGDSKQKWLAAAGIDRFLVNTGHRQLFGTQALTLPNDPEQCFFLPERVYPRIDVLANWPKY